jgi:hypothetical protein
LLPHFPHFGKLLIDVTWQHSHLMRMTNPPACMHHTNESNASLALVD